MARPDAMAVLAEGTKYALGVGSVLYLFVYIGIALARMAYPFGLEWMEGGSLVQMHRILEGKRLYVSPSVEFVPYIYPPLYFYCAAFFTHLFGFGFIPLRAISFLASLGCFALIFLIVKRETGDWFSSLMASGLFAATFEISGAWFDIARVDSLFLFFALTGAYWARHPDSIRDGIFAGIAFSLSCFTKQTAAFIAVFCMAYGFRRYFRSRFWFIGVFFVLTGGSVLMMDAFHDGWYRYYLFDIPRRHALIPNMLLIFWVQDMIRPLAIALCCGLWYLGDRQQKTAGFWMFAGIGMIGSSWLSRIHTGGYVNVLLPAHACVAIMFGLGVYRMDQFIRQANVASNYLLRTFLYAACGLQFISLLYNPLDYVPPKSSLEAGLQFIERLKAITGDVYIPRHGYLALLAGKRSFAQEMAVFDVERSGQDTETKRIPLQLKQQIDAAIENRQFAAIITDYETTAYAPYYERQNADIQGENAFPPVSGVETQPKYWYVSR